MLRYLALALFVGLQLVLIAQMHFEPGRDLKGAVALGFAVLVITVIGFLSAIQDFNKTLTAKRRISRDLVQTKERLFAIDSLTRREVGAWLHGVLQPQLMRIARNARKQGIPALEAIANDLDDISEKLVRDYAHDLYPPALHISLEAGLTALLDGRAELDLDPALTDAADIGIEAVLTSKARSTEVRPQRITLGPDLAYSVYRVVEEGVSNAWKKASTSRVKVTVAVAGGELTIVVTDDGVAPSSTITKGLGLTVIDVIVNQNDGNYEFDGVDGNVNFRVNLRFSPVLSREKIAQHVSAQINER